MKISKSKLPDNSRLNGNTKYDYVDSFQGSFKDAGNKVKSADIGKAFFNAAPKWVDRLFELRNRMVSAFGLKTSGGNTADRKTLLENFQCEAGEQLGLFKVFYSDGNEVILGEDDKHLNFRVSLFVDNVQAGKSEKDLIISTTVKFNNGFGRLYFLPVKPFHRFIVPAMLRGIIRELEGK